MRIHKLEDSVIQRPSNAVKELVENSLDAGATSVTITVQDGGYRSFTIQDNGRGIMVTFVFNDLRLQREDLVLLCERYATSKLTRIEDLRTIATFGFRGEALASISHISRIIVTTKTGNSSVGYRASYLDGKLIGEPAPIAANVGTVIQVQDLFYNNPVRVNTTVAARTEEYSRILDMVQKYACSRAGQCTFTCKRNTGTPDLVTRPTNQILDIVRLVYGDKVASALLSLEISDLARGLISNAYHQQKNLVFILFINGRLVDCPRLKRAVANLYGEILLVNTHPFVYLSLQLAGEDVDVNAHPTKKEVILLHEDEIIETIANGIREQLGNGGIVHPLNPKLKPPVHISDDVLTQVSQIRSSSGNQPRPFQIVHTDHKRRTLDSFVYNSSLKIARGEPPALQTTLGGGMSRMLVPTSITGRSESVESTSSQPNPFVRDEPIPVSSPIRRDQHVDVLLDDINRDSSSDIGDIMKRHTLVGTLDARRVFIQYDTALLLVDIPRFYVEWSYMCLLGSMGKDDRSTISVLLPIDDCLEAFWAATPSVVEAEQVCREDLKREILGLLEEQSSLFEEHFSIKISNGVVYSFPFVPGIMSERLEKKSLGGFLFRLAIDHDLDNTRSSIAQILRLIAEFFASSIDATDMPYLEHVVLPNFRELPNKCRGFPSILAKNGALMKMATTHELYRIFERC